MWFLCKIVLYTLGILILAAVLSQLNILLSSKKEDRLWLKLRKTKSMLQLAKITKEDPKLPKYRSPHIENINTITCQLHAFDLFYLNIDCALYPEWLTIKDNALLTEEFVKNLRVIFNYFGYCKQFNRDEILNRIQIERCKDYATSVYTYPVGQLEDINYLMKDIFVALVEAEEKGIAIETKM